LARLNFTNIWITIKRFLKDFQLKRKGLHKNVGARVQAITLRRE